MENLGIYCRVSSKYQEIDGNSIDYQLKDGESISKKLGMKPIIFNEGGKTSWGSNINVRPQLVKMLNEIESKNLTNIWCWNMDRLGRNSESWWTILKILVGWKVNLYVGDSIKPFDFSNPTDRLVTGVLTLISTYDNELRRIRMIFGKKESLRKGQTYIGGTITFGYSIDKNKNLIPNSSEKKVLKKIFQMYSDDKSTTDIKVMLDNSNHNPKYSKKGWNVGTIQKMLGNQIYIGKQVWNWKEKEPDGSETIIESIEIETPKLIGKNLFDDVRKRLNKYKKHNQYDTDLKSLLKGLLICGHCKLPMNHRMKQREKHQYYYCVYNERRWGKSNKGKYSKKSCEMKRSLIISQSDDLVWREFVNIFSDSSKIKEDFKKKGMFPKEKEEKQLKSIIQKERNKLSQSKKIIKSLDNSLIDVEFNNINKEYQSVEIYEGLKCKIENQISNLNKEILKVNEKIKNLNSKNIWIDWISIMNKEIEEMKNWSLDDKKSKLNQFIDKIIVKYNDVSDTHSLSMEFKFPIIEDKIIYKDLTNKSKKYSYEEGVELIKIFHKNDSYNLSINKEKLVKLFIQLRGDGKSYTEISTYLNNKGIKTIRGKKWNKHNVGRFNIYIPKSVGLKMKNVEVFNVKKKG